MAGELNIGSSSTNLTALPTPHKLTVKLQDIDSATTTRSANGTMLRDRVCGGASAKRKIEIEWNGLETPVASQILQLIGGTFFWVKYFDPYIADWRTAQFYAGDRELPVFSTNYRGEGVYLWETLKFNIIEK